LRLGQKDEAERWMQRSMEAAPRDSIVQYNATCFYALAGEMEKVLDLLRSEPRFREIVDTLVNRP